MTCLQRMSWIALLLPVGAVFGGFTPFKIQEQMRKLSLFISALLLFFSSCTAGATIKDSYLINAPELQKHSAEQVRANASSYGAAAMLINMQYGVSVRKVVYNTEYNGNTIKASGIVCIPEGAKKPLTMISMQHGTIFHDNEAPSKASWSYKELEMLASSGYAVFIPDYIGYGESKQYFHPYYDYKHSAGAVVDMLKAGKELLDKENIEYNGNVILTGYSEGGYVTLAAHKMLEENPVKGLKVIGSAAGSGGYDLPGVLNNSLVQKKSYPAPAYLAFVLMSYNKTYGWNRPLTDFFRKEYAAALPGYMDREHYGSTVNGALTSQVEQLFAPAFYSALKGEEESTLKQKLVQNSVSNWKPQAPVRLYHGTADEIVPYATSVTTYDNFKKNGAKDVQLIPVEGGTHGSSFLPMLLGFVNWVSTLEA
jgi:pimeloyl-ACP methyl ester carboxylesterase